MRDHRITWFLTAATVLMLLMFPVAPSANAQRGRGEQARPAIPIPRMPDGTPNLSWVDPAHKGAWYSRARHWDFVEFLTERKEEGIPFQPWAKALYEYRIDTEDKDDPEAFCVPNGGTRLSSLLSNWEFVQIPEQKRILRVFEAAAHVWQVIYMDGRPHPQEAWDIPTWLGHSVGHWEGDTLVIDTVGFNEGEYASKLGAPRTNLHHLIERFTRKDYYTLHYEATIDDPGAYTRSWTIAWDLTWNEGAEIPEYVCQENNKYLDAYEYIEKNEIHHEEAK